MEGDECCVPDWNDSESSSVYICGTLKENLCVTSRSRSRLNSSLLEFSLHFIERVLESSKEPFFSSCKYLSVFYSTSKTYTRSRHSYIPIVYKK